MKLDVPYFEICDVPIEIVNNIFNIIEEKDWHANDYRSAGGPVFNMEQSNSIPIHHTPLCLVYDTDGTAIRSIAKQPAYEKFYPVIKPVLDILSQHYIYNQYACFLSRLPPGGIIGLHTDDGSFLTECHRIHLPIQTNEKALYLLDTYTYNWKQGTLYEFDNTRIHGVINKGNADRIHLVINLYNI